MAAIAALGRAGLAERWTERSREVLRFRSDPPIRRRLEALLAAERNCCPFLEVELREEDGWLLASITARGAGRAAARVLAEAFDA